MSGWLWCMGLSDALVPGPYIQDRPTRCNHENPGNNATTISQITCNQSNKNSIYDTIMEPTGLISDAPAKRPADILIHFSPPAKQTSQEPVAKLLGCHHTPPIHYRYQLDSTQWTSDHNLQTFATFTDRWSHISSTSMKEKYQGKTPSSTATRIDTIATITGHNYVLLPAITIDHT